MFNKAKMHLPQLLGIKIEYFAFFFSSFEKTALGASIVSFSEDRVTISWTKKNSNGEVAGES